MMIHFTKNLYAIMFVVFCMSNITYSSDMRDEYGRTEIMNYLIQQEKEITSKKSERHRLFHKYFEMNKETNLVEKRIWATDEDVFHYRKLEDEIGWLIEETLEHIKKMVVDGADLQARDLKGKSIRDFCKTPRINDLLRELGAPMTFDEEKSKECTAFLGGVIVLSVGITVVTIVAKACYRVCFPQ